MLEDDFQPETVNFQYATVNLARLQLPSTYNFALFTLLLEDDFQSKTVNSQSATVNFACLQLPSTYNFPKMGGGDNGSTK